MPFRIRKVKGANPSVSTIKDREINDFTVFLQLLSGVCGPAVRVFQRKTAKYDPARFAFVESACLIKRPIFKTYYDYYNLGIVLLGHF